MLGTNAVTGASNPTLLCKICVLLKMEFFDCWIEVIMYAVLDSISPAQNTVKIDDYDTTSIMKVAKLHRHFKSMVYLSIVV